MRTVTVAAIASLGMAALTSCTTSAPKSGLRILTTKSAATYYEATTCKVNAATDAFSAAMSVAETSTSETGPDLDDLKAAAREYAKAAGAGASQLGDPKVLWPASIRKSVLILRDQYLAVVPGLKAMATATQMSDEAADSHKFPDTTKAAAASNHIRSTLGLPPTDSDSCSAAAVAPVTISVAPASGALITGTGYTFHAPVGWTVPTNAPQADAYVISANPDASGVYDTINVLRGTALTGTTSEIEQRSVSYLEQVVGATDVQVRPPLVVAGTARVHISALLGNDGTNEWSEQYLLTHGGTSYTVTFEFDEAESQSVRESLAESVLTTWAWT